jgi:hypothetical protein
MKWLFNCLDGNRYDFYGLFDGFWCLAIFNVENVGEDDKFETPMNFKHLNL